MPDYMLLLVEVLLVLGTACLFWLTRKQLQAFQEHNRRLPADAANTTLRADEPQALRDLADLLTEIRSAADEMREETQRQKLYLQETLGQAERATHELHVLLAQVESPAPASPVGSSPARSSQARPAFSPKLIDTLDVFSDDLRAQGRSDSAVKRSVGYVQEFTAWLGGRRSQDLSLAEVQADDVKVYSTFLNGQELRPNTIRRKIAAIETFLEWANNYDRETPAPVKALSPLAGTYASPTRSGVPGPDRHRTVLDLADQGLDQSAIAARLGMEQDAVRLLLALRHHADVPAWTPDQAGSRLTRSGQAYLAHDRFVD